MKWIYAVLLFLSAFFFPVCSDAFQTAHTDVDLIAEQSSVAPGEDVWVGLHMRMDDGWHVYWENPGDSGLAPTVRWTLPSGWQAQAVQWPVPERINLGPLTSYGYGKEVVFLVRLTTSQTTPQGPAEIKADVSWLTCRVDCVPGKAALLRSIAVASQSVNDPEFKAAFEQARGRLPREVSPWRVQVESQKRLWRMHFSGPPASSHPWFFPHRSDVIDHAADQNVVAASNGFILEIPKSNLLSESPAALDGIFVVGSSGYKIYAPVVQPSTPGLSLLSACLFALIGGLILNVMPCVLPVISLKILGLAAHQSRRRESIRHGLIFALGVMVSFWILAAVLVLIKSAGVQIGWGFQFQSPWFVAAMALVFFVLALNLFGLFEIGLGLTALGGWSANARGLGRDFLNGLLATLVATPCTAPFMGTAIAYGLTQSAVASFLIFSSLAIGMALPTLILSAYPPWLRFLPKPGPWMTTMKRLMGILMLASALWLVWVLALQTGLFSSKSQWRVYSPQLIEELKAQKKNYFLDFTAAWCLTCQVNDRLVLQNRKVVEKFKEHSIILVKADWTKQDPAITAALESYGRNSIPFYVLYSARRDRENILGETVSVQGLIQTLDEQ